MATVRLWTRFEVTANGRTYTGGSLSADQTITTTAAEVINYEMLVADTAIVKVFDITDLASELGDFDFMWAEADQNVQIEFVTDDAAANGEAYWSVQMTANIPMILSSSVSLASNGSVALFDGASENIETIRIKNVSGGTAANVRFFAIL